MMECRWRMKGREKQVSPRLASGVRANGVCPSARSTTARNAKSSSSRRAKSSCTKSAEFRKPLRDTNSRLTQSEDHSPSYVWRCPGEPLTERRSRAERRREELLHVIYQENMANGEDTECTNRTSCIEDLVREWVALVVERDQLLREQLNQENRCFYFRELQHLLQDQPPLGDNSEEVNIRETLLDLERYVTRYCRKQNIVLSPQRSQRTHLLSSHVLSKPLTFQSRAPTRIPSIITHPTSAPTHRLSQSPSNECKDSSTTKLHLEFYEHRAHVLDLETGQTGIGIQNYSDHENSISSGSLFKEGKAMATSSPYKPQVPIADQLGKDCLQGEATQSLLPNTVSSNVHNVIPSNRFSPYQGPHGSIPGETLGHIPPVSSISPPPLPSSPPFTLPPLPQLPVGMYGKGGASGTVQFAGMSYTTSARDQAGAIAKDRYREGREGGTIRSSSDEEEMTGTLAQKDHKNLLLEISTVGQSALKPTNRPRSPGGTPIHPPTPARFSDDNYGMNHHHQQTNIDLLQRALLAKFRSLHSTPVRQKGSHQLDYSNSFDFSSAWSDINSSIQVYDDPDLSNTSPSVSAVCPSGQTSRAANKTASRHNGSTAV